MMEWNCIVPGLKEAMIPEVKNYDWSVVRECIENMAPKDSVEYTQLQQIPIYNNIITESCSRGFIELLTVFLNNGFPADYAVDKSNETMLHVAAREGHLSLVKLLLKSGANVNRMSNDDKSALFSAVRRGHLDIVNYLLIAGADINTKSKSGWTALHIAAWLGNLPVMKLLIDNGADVNIMNSNGETALHLAASSYKGNERLTKLLIEYGTDVNIIDKRGNSALHQAAKSGNLQVVKFLIEHGSQINIISNICQETPLSLCIEYRRFDIAMLLINNGADLNLCIYDTVLNTAVRLHVPIHMIECLLEHGASVTAVYENITALQHTIFHCNYSNDWKLQLAKLLLIYGSNHYVEDRYGNTALHWACAMGDAELVKYLIDYGLNVDVRNRQGKKPYDIAREKGFNNIVKIIIHYHCNKYKSFD